MIGEADTDFFWFADFLWIATRSVTVFVECFVRLSKAHGLSEYWKAMFVQLGFGLANTTGRIMFFVGLQSLLEKFEQLCKFATVKGKALRVPELKVMSNGRAPAKLGNHEVPQFDIRDGFMGDQQDQNDQWIKFLAYDCSMEHRYFTEHKTITKFAEEHMALQEVFTGWSRVPMQQPITRAISTSYSL